MTEEMVSAIAEEIAKKLLSNLGVNTQKSVETEKPSYVTRQTAAEMLDCTVRTVDRYIDAGFLDKFKRGKYTVVLRWQVERLVK